MCMHERTQVALLGVCTTEEAVSGSDKPVPQLGRHSTTPTIARVADRSACADIIEHSVNYPVMVYPGHLPRACSSPMVRTHTWTCACMCALVHV